MRVNKQKRASFPFLIKGKKEARKGVPYEKQRTIT
jgi:hypothetical protein